MHSIFKHTSSTVTGTWIHLKNIFTCNIQPQIYLKHERDERYHSFKKFNLNFILILSSIFSSPEVQQQRLVAVHVLSTSIQAHV
jgi:hypothetical protein